MPSCRILSPAAAVLPGDLPLLHCLSHRDICAARLILDYSAHHAGAVVRWTAAISRFARSGFLSEAVALFDLMPHRNVVTWNALLSVYVHAGRTSAALDLFSRMPRRNVVSYTSALCALARSGRIEQAQALFAVMPQRNVFSYNVMLTALVRSGDLSGARRLFDEMPERTAASGNSLLAGYAEKGRMSEARSLFDEMDRRGIADVVSWTSLIAGYARAGNVWEAYDLFLTMSPERNVVTWTAMIGGFAWNGLYQEALSLFLAMKQMADGVIPNGETVLSLIYACAGMGFPSLGKQAHAYALIRGMAGRDEDGRLMKGLIHMYSRCGYMEWAGHIFNSALPALDAISWNSMIDGYARSGRLSEARGLFDQIAGDTGRLSWITMIVTWTTMIAAYFEAGDVEEALRLFERMPERDSTAWTAVISGLIQNEQVAEAFVMLAESRADGFATGDYALAALLGAVGSVARLDIGEQLHGLATKSRPVTETVLRNALVAMYAKGGDMEGARKVFEETARPAGEAGWRNVVTWNAMVVGLAHHGLAVEALRLFEAMRREVEPDGVTCLGMLTAWDHVGELDRAEEVIRFMEEHGIQVEAEHLACVVDMLGRAGRFDLAERLAGVAFGEAPWGALLGTCGMAREKTVGLGLRAASKLLRLDPKNAAAHVSLYNVYARSGGLEEAEEVRREMRRTGARKRPGCSWIGLRGTVHVFVCGDRSHARSDEIYRVINRITLEVGNCNDNYACTSCNSINDIIQRYAA